MITYIHVCWSNLVPIQSNQCLFKKVIRSKCEQLSDDQNSVVLVNRNSLDDTNSVIVSSDFSIHPVLLPWLLIGVTKLEIFENLLNHWI
jgi:hypothetical protein